MNSNTGLSRGKKIVVITLMSVVIVLLAVAAVLLSIKKDDTRTIMIYIAGNNLETDYNNATAEINGIDPSNIDLEKYHILLYTGGTKVWHNFVNSNENAIYELKSTGFEKVKTYDKENMGSSNTLTEFLTYAYQNYPAGNYDLMLWNHGVGSLGSIQDEFTRDFITLPEFEDALSKSPFNSKNKLQNIVFETCLNGNLELATVLAPYANYMVASEEVTLGDSVVSELVFLNKLDEIENSLQYGIAFVDGYAEKLQKMNYIFDNTSTYSVINLNEIPKLNAKLDDLLKEINLSKDYNQLARERANLYQFAVNTSDTYDYDTVDLYEYVSSLETVNEKKAKELEDFIKNKVVAYNWSKTNHANGLSIYIPYNSGYRVTKEHINGFSGTSSISKNYIDFITNFNKAKTSSSYTYSYDLSENEISNSNKEFKLKLTKDQIKNYSKASYIIFEKTTDGLFMPVYRADDAKLDDKGYVTTKLTDNLITVVDERINTKVFFTTYKIEIDDKKNKEYIAPVILTRIKDGETPVVENGVMHLKVDKKNNVSVEKVFIKNKSEEEDMETTGIAANLDDYNIIDFLKYRYKILDENGNYISDWGSASEYNMEEVVKDNYHFETSSLDDGDYYCLFVIYDVQNKPNYSNLIRIN